MTIQLHSNPSGGALATYTSKRYYAFVGATQLFCYGVEQVANLSSIAWTGGTAVEPSWVKFGCDEPVTVRIQRRVSGTATLVPITTAVVYPSDVGATYTISGGDLLLTVPPNRQFRVEVNGDRAHTIQVFAEPLKEAVPAGAVDWTTISGTAPTGTTVGQCIYFGPGIHTLGGVFPPGNPGGEPKRLFQMAANSTLYIDGGAIVVGSIDFGSALNNNALAMGPGVLSGLFSTWAAVQTYTFEQQLTFSLLYNSTYGGYGTGAVRGLTLVAGPFYTVAGGVWSARNVQVINPWNGNLDGFGVFSTHSSLLLQEIVRCFVFAGDDAVRIPESSGHSNINIEETYAITANDGCFAFGFWADYPGSFLTTITNCCATHLGVANHSDYAPPWGAAPHGPIRGNNAAIRWWCDGRKDQLFWGRYNVSFTNFRTFGRLACSAVVLDNAPYPASLWGSTANDRYGTTANWVFDGLTFDTLPEQLSIIDGLDRRNTPTAIYFFSVRIGGQQVRPESFDSYFSRGVATYGIYLDGHEMTTAVDLCNLALARIGESARLFSIQPVDGSAQADICARFYSFAIGTVLSHHPWSCATLRATTVEVTAEETDAWPYVYEVPGNYLSVRALLPEGVTDLSRGLSRVDYSIEQGTTGVQRIYTNQPVATIVYTFNQLNPNAFPPLLVDALVWKIAAEIAGPIYKGEVGAAESKRCEQMFMFTVQKAAAADSSQRDVRPEQNVDWLEARGFSQ